MFGLQEHLIREVSGVKERSGDDMDPVRSWVRNVGVVDANVAAQRYGAFTSLSFSELRQRPVLFQRKNDRSIQTTTSD